MSAWFETHLAQTLLTELHVLSESAHRIEKAYGSSLPETDPVCIIGSLETKRVHKGLSHDWRTSYTASGGSACESILIELENLRYAWAEANGDHDCDSVSDSIRAFVRAHRRVAA